MRLRIENDTMIKNDELRKYQMDRQDVKISIRKKILGVTLVAALPFLAISIYLLISMSNYNHTYNKIDEIDYQILVEADFLVNIMEDGLSKEAALKAYHSIFKTTCGKMICREMFDIGVR